MKTVWKYPIARQMSTSIDMPAGASPLRVGIQSGFICIWVCVIPELEKERRNFQVSGTGDPVPLSAKYIGSVTDGPFEWHVWEI